MKQYRKLGIKLAAIVMGMALLALLVGGIGCTSPPEASFTAEPKSGSAPLTVQFTDRSEGNITAWAWDFNDDGTVDSTEQNPSYTYDTPGEYTVSLTVTGPGGSDTKTKDSYIEVGTPQGLNFGLVIPLTGSQAGKFHDLLYTTEWLAEDINSGNHWLAEEGGGIKIGDTIYNVSIIAEGGTSDNMYAGVSKLYYEDGVIMILGQCGSAGVVSIHTIIEGEGMLYVGAAATSRDTMYFHGEPVEFFCRTQSLAGDKVASVYTQMFGPDGFYKGYDKNADGVTSIYQILPDSIDGYDIADCADAFITAHPEYGLKLAGRDFLTTPVEFAQYTAVISNIMTTTDADVIDSGSTLEKDQAKLMKELDEANWDGLTVQPVGGGTWSQLIDIAGEAALEGLVQDYRPPSVEVEDPDYVAWMEAQGLERPDWVNELWDTRATVDPRILCPTAVIQYYSEGSNMLQAMQIAGSTEQTRENALAIRDALVEIPVVSYFGDLYWGGVETYGRKCALDCLVHRGYFLDNGTMEWLGPLLLSAP